MKQGRRGLVLKEGILNEKSQVLGNEIIPTYIITKPHPDCQMIRWLTEFPSKIYGHFFICSRTYII